MAHPYSKEKPTHEDEVNPFESPHQLEKMHKDLDPEEEQYHFEVTASAAIEPTASPIDFERLVYWARLKFAIVIAWFSAAIAFLLILSSQANHPFLHLGLYSLIPLILILAPVLIFFVRVYPNTAIDRQLERWFSQVRPLHRKSSTFVASQYVFLEELTAENRAPSLDTIQDIGRISIDQHSLTLETTQSSMAIPLGAVGCCEFMVFEASGGNKMGLIRLEIEFNSRTKEVYFRPGLSRLLPWTMDYQRRNTAGLFCKIVDLCLQNNPVRHTDQSIVTATIYHSQPET